MLCHALFWLQFVRNPTLDQIKVCRRKDLAAIARHFRLLGSDKSGKNRAEEAGCEQAHGDGCCAVASGSSGAGGWRPAGG